jgi:hypothetical protein
MDPATALVLLAMLILTGAFIARPLAAGGGKAVDEGERRLSTLYAQQDQILAFLQELDMDFAMGKILPEDHEAQRAEWLARGADVLKEIDELGNSRAGPGDLDVQLEAKVARLRQTIGQDSESALEKSLEVEVARRKEALRSAAGYCGHCGQPLVAGDRFCSRCGTPVPSGTPA